MEDEESSLPNPYVAQPSRADQKATSEMWNMPAETSRPAEPSKGGQIKLQVNKGWVALVVEAPNTRAGIPFRGRGCCTVTLKVRGGQAPDQGNRMRDGFDQETLSSP